jgi:hypothetical protein
MLQAILPEFVDYPQLLHALAQFWSQVGSQHIEDLVDLPLMTNPGGKDRAGLTLGSVSTFCMEVKT